MTRIPENVEAILTLLAVSLHRGTSFQEAFDCLSEAYLMGLQDGSKSKERTARTVETIKRNALHG